MKRVRSVKDGEKGGEKEVKEQEKEERGREGEEEVQAMEEKDVTEDEEMRRAPKTSDTKFTTSSLKHKQKEN